MSDIKPHLQEVKDLMKVLFDREWMLALITFREEAYKEGYERGRRAGLDEADSRLRFRNHDMGQ